MLGYGVGWKIGEGGGGGARCLRQVFALSLVTWQHDAVNDFKQGPAPGNATH